MSVCGVCVKKFGFFFLSCEALGERGEGFLDGDDESLCTLIFLLFVVWSLLLYNLGVSGIGFFYLCGFFFSGCARRWCRVCGVFSLLTFCVLPPIPSLLCEGGGSVRFLGKRTGRDLPSV